MKQKLAWIATSLFFTSAASAEEYQIFSEATYGHSEYSESYALTGQYFFDAKKTLGPLNEFKYINTISYVSARANLASPLDSKDVSVAGEWIDGAFGLGASVTYQDNVFDSGYSSSQAIAKYFFSSNLYAGVSYKDYDNGESQIGAFASYEYGLTGNDYLGVSGSYTKNSEIEDSDWNLQGKYYNDLGNGHFWVLHGHYFQTQYDQRAIDDIVLSVGTIYYFSKRTSVGFDYGQLDSDYGLDRETYQGSATHYFTANFYVSGIYTESKYESSLFDDNNAYYLKAGLQF